MTEHVPAGRRVAPMVRLGTADTFAKPTTTGPMHVAATRAPARALLPRYSDWPGSVSL